MSFTRHPDFRAQHFTIGAERSPLLVIDNVLANAEELVELAAAKTFADVATYYPGIRAKVPLTYQRFVLEDVGREFAAAFGVSGASLRFTSCHFSLITTPAANLTYLQRIPHIDSQNSNELALVHYLFKSDLGGTSFYRHRATGFEFVDQSRNPEYWRHVQAEQPEVERTSTGYICGDTQFYERIGHQDGVFNRMLVYRRTSLHSGAMRPDFVPVADPRVGRLSINAFLA